MAKPIRKKSRERDGDRHERKGELKPIKKLSNGSILYSNNYVRTPVGRLNFVNFVTPKTNEREDGSESESYGTAILFAPGENLSLLKLGCERFLKEEKGEKGMKRYRRRPLREQDDKVDDYDGFEEGGWYMNCSSKYKPKVTGRDKGEIELSSFYSGCYSRLLVSPYLYDVSGNRGVAYGLAGAQFIRDGEPLGGGGVDPESWADDEGDDDGQEHGDDDEESEDEDEEEEHPRGKKNKFV